MVRKAQLDRAAVRCGLCSFWLLVLPVLCQHGLDAQLRYSPGDRRYWVKLRSIDVSEGVLDPPFEEHGVTDYKLRVKSPYSQVLVLTLGLNLQMYNLLECPLIIVDGKRLRYSPLSTIFVTVPLNETVGPFDKTVHIAVMDPQKGSWLRARNLRTYRIHVTQPPEFESIVQAKAIIVTDSSGQELVSQPQFKSDSYQSSYHYELSEDQAVVNVQVACSDMATGMRYDAEPVRRGAVRTINMTHRVHMETLVACAYYNPLWTHAEETRTYVLGFRHTSSELGDAPPELSMLPDCGYCETRAEHEAMLGQAPVATSPLSFVCTSDSPQPRLMAAYGHRAEEVVLVGPDQRMALEMRSYLPVAVPRGRGREDFTLRERAGEQTREYTVTMVWPAKCDSMVCPKHFTPRRNLENEELAALRTCRAERCSERDLHVCCKQLANCSSLSCPVGKQLVLGAVSRDCAGTVCGEEDIGHCCESQATCRSCRCSTNMVQRSDAASILCGGSSCSEKDKPHCCLERASCSTWECPVGSKVLSAARSRLCHTEVCGKEDEDMCCEEAPAGDSLWTGVVDHVNDDGSYAVHFDNGEADKHVPEWALRGGQNHSNLRPGEHITVSKSEDGFGKHKHAFGWVRTVHSDRTYTVEYDNGEVDEHVPSWALRAVDEYGHIFVHSELFSEGERVVASRTEKGYHKEEFAVATVTRVNSDGTYTVRYASGEEDQHVPRWDLRVIDSEGRSYPRASHNLGDSVEVFLGAQAPKHQAHVRRAHKDQLRTKFLLGHVSGANPDGTYSISYDFGGKEDSVPVWAMRYLDKNLHNSLRSRYRVGDRVEARISMNTANNLTGWGIEALGIATREKVVFYRQLNCWPAAGRCGQPPAAAEAPPRPQAPEVPSLPDYDVVANRNGLELCYYDETCSEREAPGCFYDPKRPKCRACGFGGFPRCPKPYDCSDGFPSAWPQVQKDWCCQAYNVGCPYECRWGKWWPDQANGWGPWWSEEKREWCCKNQKIGCPDAGESQNRLYDAFPRGPVEIRAVADPSDGNATEPRVANLMAQRGHSSAGKEAAEGDESMLLKDGHSMAHGLAFKYDTKQHRRQLTVSSAALRPLLLATAAVLGSLALSLVLLRKRRGSVCGGMWQRNTESPTREVAPLLA